MPRLVTPATRGAARGSVASRVAIVPQLAPRNCSLRTYRPIREVPAVSVTSQVVAYASPDSTYAVTRRLLDRARRSLLIGIYDFSAEHVKELVLAALRRGVRVELMLDIDSEKESKLFEELAQFGARCVPAPACSSRRARYFRSAHEKVVVIDDEWTLVQSGNYSDNSIPLNVVDGGDPQAFVTGNRDTGLAVRSKPLARFFRRLLESDIALELDSPARVAARLEPPSPDAFLVEPAPLRTVLQQFPSRVFERPGRLRVQPVLSPDNYLEFVPPLLAAARTSILVEQQYIRASQPLVGRLLRAIAQARAANPELDVRIVLGKVFGRDELAKERANLDLLAREYGLALGTHIRYIDTSRFVHCHNKLVLVDGQGVLVGSQNWSDSAVAQNREASLWLRHPGIGAYFTAIFEHDWQTGLQRPGRPAAGTIGADELRRGRYVRVAAADYAEV